MKDCIIKIFLLITVFFASACSTKLDLTPEAAEEQEESSAETLDRGALYEAMVWKDNVAAVEQVVGDRSLKGMSELYHLVSCDRIDLAEYLFKKGAHPQEKVIDLKPPLTFRSHMHYQVSKLKPPLEDSLAGCEKLTAFYLEKMTPSEVAAASMTVKLDDDEIPLWGEIFGDYEQSFIPRKREAIEMARKKNAQYCAQGEETNCKAAAHLKEQIENFAKIRRDKIFAYACGYNQQLGAYQERMKLQLEFGEKTGVASPKTYDQLVSNAQDAMTAVNYYSNLYFNETGERLNLANCYR